MCVAALRQMARLEAELTEHGACCCCCCCFLVFFSRSSPLPTPLLPRFLLFCNVLPPPPPSQVERQEVRIDALLSQQPRARELETALTAMQEREAASSREREEERRRVEEAREVDMLEVQMAVHMEVNELRKVIAEFSRREAEVRAHY